MHVLSAASGNGSHGVSSYGGVAGPQLACLLRIVRPACLTNQSMCMAQSPTALEPGSVSLILLAGGVGKRMGVRQQ